MLCLDGLGRLASLPMLGEETCAPPPPSFSCTEPGISAARAHGEQGLHVSACNPRQNFRYVFGSLSRPYRLIVTPQNCRR